jgi:transposase
MEGDLAVDHISPVGTLASIIRKSLKERCRVHIRRKDVSSPCSRQDRQNDRQGFPPPTRPARRLLSRDQLIVEAGRWRNHAHALLRVAAPGYQAKTGALASAGSVRRARAVARRASEYDPVRGRLAVQALDRLTALERDAGRLEREIRELLGVCGCTHLLAIRGVGPIVAAKILGETRGTGRFRSAAAFAAHSGTAPVPASSGRTHRHRLNRGGNRQLNRALYTIAMVRSRPAGTPPRAPTSSANSRKARAQQRPDAA